jgi:K+/H+ antiporter YhaU regulatory subunit KhtT
MLGLEKVLRDLGLEVQVVVAADRSIAAGVMVEDLERSARGAFFIVQINHKTGEVITRPARDEKIEAGDSLVVVGRGAGAVSAFFATPAQRPKAGRVTF